MNGLTIQLLLLAATMMMLLMSLVIAAIVPGMDRWSKRFFIAFFTVLLLYGCVTLPEVFIEGRPGIIFVLGILYYIDSLFSSILVPMLTAYLLHCCGEGLCAKNQPKKTDKNQPCRGMANKRGRKQAKLL